MKTFTELKQKYVENVELQKDIHNVQNEVYRSLGGRTPYALLAFLCETRILSRRLKFFSDSATKLEFFSEAVQCNIDLTQNVAELDGMLLGISGKETLEDALAWYREHAFDGI